MLTLTEGKFSYFFKERSRKLSKTFVNILYFVFFYNYCNWDEMATSLQMFVNTRKGFLVEDPIKCRRYLNRSKFQTRNHRSWPRHRKGQGRIKIIQFKKKKTCVSGHKGNQSLEAAWSLRREFMVVRQGNVSNRTGNLRCLAHTLNTVSRGFFSYSDVKWRVKSENVCVEILVCSLKRVPVPKWVFIR